jgi:hypothetical protein
MLGQPQNPAYESFVSDPSFIYPLDYQKVTVTKRITSWLHADLLRCAKISLVGCATYLDQYHVELITTQMRQRSDCYPAYHNNALSIKF